MGPFRRHKLGSSEAENKPELNQQHPSS